MKGVYLVFFQVEESMNVEVGALGEISFKPGIYAYVGSAMNSLESRVSRHFSGKKENPHWHIDYFSAKAEPLGFIAFATGSEWECILSQALNAESDSVRNFGASDCDCRSHLYMMQDGSVI